MIGKKIVDLQGEIFNFCGGMNFQLDISDKLQKDLQSVQPIIYDASKDCMQKIPNYTKSSSADQINVFYGREVRSVPHAVGGMGFVLQLVSSKDDPEGWSKQEIQEYNGWDHDSDRKWRNAEEHLNEGNQMYKNKFGPKAYGLHHRFYWHMGKGNQLWLSAEDGCEGVLVSRK